MPPATLVIFTVLPSVAGSELLVVSVELELSTVKVTVTASFDTQAIVPLTVGAKTGYTQSNVISSEADSGIR